MEPTDINMRLLNITAEATRYCQTLENVRDMEKDEFVNEMTEILPRIYVEFISLAPEDVGVLDYGYYQNYVEEDWYETVRRNIEYVLGPDDVFLETFEEDMKYSDTPIASSISESLADIFQALYNFIIISRESDGQESAGSYTECRENFAAYWGQTLCNVLRALNHLRFNPTN